ncbi:MAG: hypothetical protein ABI743_10155 [bacterium]
MADQKPVAEIKPEAVVIPVKTGLGAIDQPMKPFVAPAVVMAVPKPQADPKSADTVTPGIPAKTDKAAPAAPKS